MLQSMRQCWANSISAPLIALLIWIVLTAQTQAAVVTPAQMLVAETQLNDLQNVQAFLARTEVTNSLIELGVDPGIAAQRVQRLSAEELAQLSNDINTLPAGGIFEVLGVVLVVLIVLEILGVTNIFTRL